MKKNLNLLLLSFFLSATSVTCFSQLKPVYGFWKDDSLVKKKYYDQTAKDKNDLIASLDKEKKKDYKEIYESRFEEVSGLLTSSRTVTATEAHSYLQSVLKKIIDANAELKPLQLRVVFTRDWWPNAYSLGEGTIAFNAGLFVYLNNEAEVAFVLCHELAHYYLDHSGKRLDKMMRIIKSDSLKKAIKRLSKMEYRMGEEYEKLTKLLAFDIKRHSREGEQEADRVGLSFLKNTGYDGSGFVSSMNLLDKVDDTTLFNKLNLSKVLSFPAYPFKERWIKKQTAIFSAMNPDDESGLTKNEIDSLKTHPDCSKRITLLADSASAIHGKEFQISEKSFHQLKQDFVPEMVEEVYKNGNISFNLYLNLQMLQEGKYSSLAIYSVARNLNLLYKKQKAHELGLAIDTENKRFDEDYNELLRMLYRMRLNEVAELAYEFCNFYQGQMKGYSGFEEEMQTARTNKSNHK